MGAIMKLSTHMLGDRRVGQFTDLKALDMNATVKEAIDKGYLIGKQDLVVANVSGVVRSMVDAIGKDGNGRKIDGYVSLQPSVRCKLADNCEPLDKDNVEASILARVLKEGAIDVSDWTITVEGATGNLTLNTITTGEKIGEVMIGEAIDMNGNGLALAETDTMTWSATDGTQTLTGTIDATKRTCTETRITTAADVLAALTGATWDGATITFTVAGNGKKAIKTATLRVAA